MWGEVLLPAKLTAARLPPGIRSSMKLGVCKASLLLLPLFLRFICQSYLWHWLVIRGCTCVYAQFSPCLSRNVYAGSGYMAGCMAMMLGQGSQVNCTCVCVLCVCERMHGRVNMCVCTCVSMCERRCVWAYAWACEHVCMCVRVCLLVRWGGGEGASWDVHKYKSLTLRLQYFQLCATIFPTCSRGSSPVI